ncbi:MAG: c-type cytochrome biogenesis protein CcmI [Litorilituus sp.]|jgi:cytochrome c-type biogenesis protein CcmH|nr:c-type cytochrome biogenesis protein CcmI [Litorilituus sp.]
MEIVFILLAFIIMLLSIIWLPYFKQDKTQQRAAQVASAQQGVRAQTNIELYHEHKAEIEKDFKEGRIDEENYQYLLAELDSSLLQDIKTAEQPKVIPNASKSLGAIWPVSLSLFVVVFSVCLYLKQGTLDGLITTPIASHNMQQNMSADQQEQLRQKQMHDYIKELQRHIDDNPDDSKAWHNLAQTLVSAGSYNLAIHAYEQVIRIEGEHAELLGAIAQASYYQHGQQIDEHVKSLIDRALALDANDPSTNILLGMHHFMSQQFPEAIQYWQRIIDDNRPEVNIAAIEEAVKEAKKRLAQPKSTSSPKAVDVSGPQLKISVSLSTEVEQQLALGEDKVVFVYALPSDGQRMPLAAVKLMASDLPKVVTLNNDQAMTAENNLSSVETVHLFAIVSNQGSAGIKPGDFKGETLGVLVNNTEIIHLIINDLVE